MGRRCGVSKVSTGQEFINFYGGGNVNCQNLPPAGSDFALRATQGQSQILAVPIAASKTLGVEEKGLRFTQAFELVL